MLRYCLVKFWEGVPLVRRIAAISCIVMLTFVMTDMSAQGSSGFIITDNTLVPNTVFPMGKVLISCQVSHPLGPMHIESVAASVHHGGWITTYPVLYDNGTHGDVTPDDGIYSLEIQAAKTPCEASIVFHASDKDRNEIESEPVILVVK
jgi:hypothetical protein